MSDGKGEGGRRWSEGDGRHRRARGLEREGPHMGVFELGEMAPDGVLIFSRN